MWRVSLKKLPPKRSRRSPHIYRHCSMSTKNNSTACIEIRSLSQFVSISNISENILQRSTRSFLTHLSTKKQFNNTVSFSIYRKRRHDDFLLFYCLTIYCFSIDRERGRHDDEVYDDRVYPRSSIPTLALLCLEIKAQTVSALNTNPKTCLLQNMICISFSFHICICIGFLSHP